MTPALRAGVSGVRPNPAEECVLRVVAGNAVLDEARGVWHRDGSKRSDIDETDGIAIHIEQPVCFDQVRQDEPIVSRDVSMKRAHAGKDVVRGRREEMHLVVALFREFEGLQETIAMFLVEARENKVEIDGPFRAGVSKQRGCSYMEWRLHVPVATESDC
jgi:hypothetical protein